jgi:signal transduction histidine kinase
MTPADKVVDADRVYAEQVVLVYRQLPVALSVNLIIAALTTSVLGAIGGRRLPLLWFAAIAAVTAARWLLWRRYQSGRGAGGTRRWGTLATLGSLCAGLAWGVGAALLSLSLPPAGQAFLITVVCGMSAGAIAISVSHLPTLLAFVLSASLPIVLRFAIVGSATGHVLGAMGVVFAAAMALGGRHLNRIFTEGMRLRIELNEANLRLQAEMAEHRTTEAALRQAQKFEAIGHLTGGIAHDFNNLLTVVIGNLLLARGHAGVDPALARLLDGALQSAERGVALIQRLLGFARRQRLDPRPIDLRRLVAGIEPMLRQILGQAVNMVVAAGGDLEPAQADANQVELAILNLAINARDAMPAGGSLRIGLEKRAADHAAPAELGAGDYAVISIADSGAGMDEATLARVFDPFFTTKEAGTGSGLGLPMVQGFAMQSGGAVQIRSRLGAGTTVELWLPTANELPVDAADNEREAELAHGTATILLCDDDDDVRHFIGDFLASIGYAVHAAQEGGMALRLLDRHAEIALIIVDYAMPGMNGLETIREACFRRPGLKSLLVTGYAGAVAGSTAGVPLLRKPFAPAELARCVADILTPH